jgi:hypothetical protein
VLPREIVATTNDGTFEFGGVLSPESTGLEGVDGGNLGLWVLAEDLSDVTFVNGMARAGHMNPVFAHRVRVTLAPSQIEVERSLCRERTWNRVWAGCSNGVWLLWPLAFVEDNVAEIANTYTAPGPSFPNENTWKCGSASDYLLGQQSRCRNLQIRGSRPRILIG